MANPAVAPRPAALGAADDLRRDDDALLWLLDLLAPVVPDLERPSRRYGVLPKAETPRYLLPLDARRATKGVVLRPGNGGTVKQGVLRAALSTALRLGVLPLVGRVVHVPDGRPGSPSLLQWLEEVLGEERLVMSLAIGPPRPNRKPVLQLLTPDGRTVCFAKMAVDDHTAHLIRNESTFLAAHRPKDLVVPRSLGLRTWKGRDIAMFSALALVGRDAGEAGLRLTPEMVLDIAGLMPMQRTPVAGSGWWSAVETRAHAETGGRATALRTATRSLNERLAGVTWTFGAWHGDLTGWNAEEVDGVLHVWDWERAGGPVPLGFDAIHCSYQLATLRDHDAVGDAARRAGTTQAGLLTALGVPTEEQALLVDCYLMEWTLRLFDGARNGSLGGFDQMIPDLLAHLVRRTKGCA